MTSMILSASGARSDAYGAATLDDGVEDGAAFAGIGIAEEEPVFLFMRAFHKKKNLEPDFRKPQP